MGRRRDGGTEGGREGGRKGEMDLLSKAPSPGLVILPVRTGDLALCFQRDGSIIFT